MRLRVRHEIAYRLAAPATRAIHVLRLTPRGHDGQFVIGWRIDIDRDCRLVSTHDPFGNIVHSFTVEGPLDGLVVTAVGEVETQDSNGIVTGQVEPMPPEVFLRDTALTRADEAVRSLAEAAAADAGHDPLATLHGIMARIRDRMAFEPGRDPDRAAAEALADRRGGAADFAHVFAAAARHAGIPARYVGGCLCEPPAGSGHAWAEALVPGLGWVAFDPASGICATDAYVRVAVGLDRLGAAPVRGTWYGGADPAPLVEIAVEPVGRSP